MNSYISIHLAYSGVKLLLVQSDGKILAEHEEGYQTYHPHPKWSEQNPEEWWCAVKKGLKTLLKGRSGSSVKGVCFAGQPHGLVAMDKSGKVIRRCMLSSDCRADKQTKYLNETVGRQKLSSLVGNVAFVGFTAPKLLWLKENEPVNFSRIAKILSPKDYIAFMASGKYCTDFSDASGTLLLDVANKRWSKDMCELCGIAISQLPKLCESWEPIGKILPELATELGLAKTVKVIMGASDSAASAIGTGTVGRNKCAITLAASGTMLFSNDKYVADSNDALNSFCHSDGGWSLTGGILSAASCRKWWLVELLNSWDYDADDHAAQSAQTDGLYFLPYLSGERNPHNDVKAKGAFIGLTSTTTRAQMSKAVMEGVAFAFRDCLEAARASGLNASRAVLSGGGVRSRVWREIIADVLNLSNCLPFVEQSPAYGAAILAMVGCGEYESVKDGIVKVVKLKDEIKPNKQSAEKYDKKYAVFKQLYPLLKDVYSKM